MGQCTMDRESVAEENEVGFAFWSGTVLCHEFRALEVAEDRVQFGIAGPAVIAPDTAEGPLADAVDLSGWTFAPDMSPEEMEKIKGMLALGGLAGAAEGGQ